MQPRSPGLNCQPTRLKTSKGGVRKFRPSCASEQTFSGPDTQIQGIFFQIKTTLNLNTLYLGTLDPYRLLDPGDVMLPAALLQPPLSRLELRRRPATPGLPKACRSLEKSQEALAILYHIVCCAILYAAMLYFTILYNMVIYIRHRIRMICRLLANASITWDALRRQKALHPSVMSGASRRASERLRCVS